MNNSQAASAIRPGDVVRVISLAGLNQNTSIRLGNIHTAHSTEGGSLPGEPCANAKPFIRLLDTPGADTSFQIELEARADAPRDSAVARRMAEVMREREGLTGACTADDLARAGFTSAEIIEFCDEARGIAGAPSELVAA